MASKARRKDVSGHEPDPPTPADRAVGRDASSPTEIPQGGWWAVLKRVWNESGQDNLSLVAAGCAFYTLLALFPGLSVAISIYGLVFDPTTVEPQLETLRPLLPAAAYDMVAQRVHDLVTAPPAALGWGLVLSILLALWSATAGIKALIGALNVVYEEEEKRGILKYNLLAILLTLGAIVGTLVALAVMVGVPAVLNFFSGWLGPLGKLLVTGVSWLLLAGFIILALAVIYRWAPSRNEPKWRWVTPGSLLATVLLLVASGLFSVYVANFAGYDATYGSLGAVVAAMMWFFIAAYVVLLGAEFNAELELQTAHDTTNQPEKPMGRRGAFVADHVATG